MRTKPFEKLEVGKTYLTRSGEQVKNAESTGCPAYPFEGGSLDASQDDTVGTDSWKTNGQYLSHEDNHRWDLVSEVIEDGGVAPGPYKTTGGLDAVVLATDAPDSEYPLVGYIVTSSGHIDPTHWTLGGKYLASETGPRDLVLAPAVVPTLREAAEALLVEYVRYFNKYHDHLADPEQESVVKNLRAALAQSEQ